MEFRASDRTLINTNFYRRDAKDAEVLPARGNGKKMGGKNINHTDEHGRTRIKAVK